MRSLIVKLSSVLIMGVHAQTGKKNAASSNPKVNNQNDNADAENDNTDNTNNTDSNSSHTISGLVFAVVLLVTGLTM